jgi:ribosomal protein S18 acetylase RimI-like enzyme
MSIVIRPMNVDDFAQVYKLGLQCYDVQDKPYNYWSIREVADHLETHPKLCFVAEANGRVVGFVLGAAKYEILEDTGHLEWVAVASDYRRKGLASRLVTTMVDAFTALGKARVATDVSSANVASRGMAKALGFTEGISVTFFVKELPRDPARHR